MPDKENALYFLVETYENGKWNWETSFNSITDAINRFRQLLLADSNAVVRLTSPTDTAIYR